MALGNSGDDISLWNGDIMIDMAANYGGMGVGAGHSWQLDTAFEDSTSNDDVANWCEASDEIADAGGDMGTPGVTGVCFEEEEVLATCEDTDGGLGICASFFDADPSLCGSFDSMTGAQASTRWRCAAPCGGGTTEGGDDPIETCADTAGDATDEDGDGCLYYAAYLKSVVCTTTRTSRRWPCAARAAAASSL